MIDYPGEKSSSLDAFVRSLNSESVSDAFRDFLATGPDLALTTRSCVALLRIHPANPIRDWLYKILALAAHLDEKADGLSASTLVEAAGLITGQKLLVSHWVESLLLASDTDLVSAVRACIDSGLCDKASELLPRLSEVLGDGELRLFSAELALCNRDPKKALSFLPVDFVKINPMPLYVARCFKAILDSDDLATFEQNMSLIVSMPKVYYSRWQLLSSYHLRRGDNLRRLKNVASASPWIAKLSNGARDLELWGNSLVAV